MTACMAVCAYTVRKDYRTLLTAYDANKLDPLKAKCWKQLNFLDMKTGGGMKHLRQVKNNADTKRASQLTKANEEYGWMSEIDSIVADDPQKIRGDRTEQLIYEEAGSSKKLLKSWVQGDSLVNLGGKKIGIRIALGCVCKGTKVWTKDGKPCNIEDITKETGILGYNGTMGSPEEVTYLQPIGKKQCVHLETSLGESLDCSTDHPLLVLVGRGKYKYATFKHAEELKKGDTLLMANTVGTFGNHHEDDAYLLGMLFGDGNYTDGTCASLSITTNEVYNWLNSRYNLGISKLRESSEGIYAQVYFRGMRPLLEKYNMWGQSKDRKRFPVNIWGWDKQSICDFLGGYFEADGNVQVIKNKHLAIKLTSAYKENVDNVQRLLLKLGINSYICYEKKKGSGTLTSRVNGGPCKIHDTHDAYVLYIDNAEYVDRFRSVIHFKSKYKQERIDSFVRGVSRRVYNNVPFRINITNGKGKFFEGKTLDNLQGVTVKKVESIGEQIIYNLTANTTHTYLTNRFISGNTGGDMEGVEGLTKLFTNPEAFNILPFKNYDTDDERPVLTGFFCPSHKFSLIDEFVDSRGVTDYPRFKEYYIAKFRKKLSGQALIDESAEHCFTPTEALMKRGENQFDGVAISERLMQLKVLKAGAKLRPISLLWDKNRGNGMEFVTVHDNPNSKLLIVEEPIIDETTRTPYDNLYVAGIDSIDQGSSDSASDYDVSDFCLIIMKRARGMEPPRIVAMYKDRPKDIREAYDITMKALIWYNAKAVLEYTKLSIFRHFQERKKDYLFLERPDWASGISKTKIRSTKRLVGVPSTTIAINHGLELVADFVSDYVYTIDYEEILHQLLNYTYEDKRKYDIVASLQMVMIGNEQLTGLIPKAKNYLEKEWKDFGYYTDEKGIKRYGVLPKR